MAFNTLNSRRIETQAPTPAEKAMEERNRAHRQYRRTVLADRDQLFRSSQEGDMLRKFAATLAHFKGENEDRMVRYVRDECHNWLRNAEEKYRIEALRLVNERCMRNRIHQGKPPLDDPLPGQLDDAFRLCKMELGL